LFITDCAHILALFAAALTYVSLEAALREAWYSRVVAALGREAGHTLEIITAGFSLIFSFATAANLLQMLVPRPDDWPCSSLVACLASLMGLTSVPAQVA